jgi:hypothetical protein
MTKDELLKIYNSPAYRVAKYNYVWKDDSNSLSSFWTNYENRRQQEMKDELSKANLALEKAELKKEQNATAQDALEERYIEAQTALSNAQIAYDSAVKTQGRNSTEALVAKNNLDKAIAFQNRISEKLGTATMSEANVAAEASEASEELSTKDIESKANQLERDFNEGKIVSEKQIDDLLENPPADVITEEIKDKLSKLRKSIKNRKIAAKKSKDAKDAADKAEREKERSIRRALTNWRTNRTSWEILKNNGFRKELKTDGSSELIFPEKYYNLQ